MITMQNNKFISTIPVGSVEIQDPFLSRYIGMVEDKIIPYQWQMLNNDEKSGIIHDFRVAAGEIEGKHIGMVFQDEGLPKWLQAAAYSLAHHPNEKIEEWADYAIDLMARAQQDDGYLLTYFILQHPDKRFKNLLESHELLCLGNILEAGVTYYEATGKRKLLDVAIKLGDHLCDCFGPDSSNPGLVPGHPGIEFALIRLYRATGSQKYLALAKHFIDTRGTDPEVLERQHREEWRLESIFPQWFSFADHTYMQIHKPVREQTTAEGHAVRATYLYSGMADLYMETGDESLLKACETLYDNLIGKRMYITGGIGSADCGERFTTDYDLPNDTNYAESCASIGLALFCRRMFQCTGDAKYLDTAERALYNTVTGGVSLDGEHFFYVNPLEVWPEATKLNPTKRHVKPVRQDWYQVACCPQNILRTLAGFDEYIYYVKDDIIYTGLFVGGSAKLSVNGKTIELQVETKYPFSNRVCIRVNSTETFALAVRKPGWSKSVSLLLNGQEIHADENKGMFFVRRDWKSGDTLELVMEMPAVIVAAHPQVRANAGKCAVVKGPLVYCLEEIDNGSNLNAISISPDTKIEEIYEPDLLGGTLTLHFKGSRTLETNWNGNELYKPYQADTEQVKLKAIPYCMWNNRGTGEMLVWMSAR